MDSPIPQLVGVVFAAVFLPLSISHGGDVVEEFDGTEVDSAVWESTGAKSVTVSGGTLTWGADGSAWASGDIATTQAFSLPPVGETTTITWVMKSPAIAFQNPNDPSSVRFQLGVHSALETSTLRDHFLNTAGGVWLDIDTIVDAVPGSVAGTIRADDDTKTASSQAQQVAPVNITWDWKTTDRTFRLDITSTTFEWFENGSSLGSANFSDYGIDAEFASGFRVFALGMNFDAGVGSIEVERIEIVDKGEQTSLITSFTGTPEDPVSNEKVTLSWFADADATLSIDQGVGGVASGNGSMQIFAPVVAEEMEVVYTLTATKGMDMETRQLSLMVSPPPELFSEDFLDHFEGSTLDPANWETTGAKSFTVGSSKVNWDASGGTWASGEVTTVPVFPIPEAGKPTTITWTVGPGAISTAGPAGDSLRVLLGISSSFERNEFGSLQHFLNSSGGVWLDVESINASRPGGVSGRLYFANDTKLANANGFLDAEEAEFDVPDWNWQTENHEFSLVLTDLGYTWMSGSDELWTGTWLGLELDDEFANGFQIMALGGNWDTGSGTTSLDAVEVRNGAANRAALEITAFSYDAGTKMISLTWNSKDGARYGLDASTDLRGVWIEEIEEVNSQGVSTALMQSAAGFLAFSGGDPERLFIRIRELAPQN